LAADDTSDKDGGDPIDRAIRRRAEADKSAQKIVAEAGAPSSDRATKSSAVPFEAPKRTAGQQPTASAEAKTYQPAEKSFFSTSAEERAEQARRAAQRVRRRARGEDVTSPARTTESAPKPQQNAPAVKAPAPPPPPAPAPAPPPSAAAAPRPPAPPIKSTSSSGSSIMDRAISKAPKPAQAPPPRPENKPPKPVGQKSATAKPPQPRPSAEDMIARSAERAEKRAPKAPPRQPLDDSGKAIKPTSAPTPDRASVSAKANPTRTVEAPRPEKSAKVGTAKPSLIARSKRSKPESDPMSGPAAPATNRDTRDDNHAEDEASLYSKDAAVVPTSGITTAKTKPFAAFEWMIASRYLRARKKEGFVSVITGFSLVGIALGVATLIVVMAVMTGFRETLINQIIGGSPHINVTSQVGPFENYDEVADQIRTVDGVRYVTPVVQGQVLGTGNDRHTGVLVRGMRKDDLERLIENAEPEVLNGSLADFTEDNGLALGSNLAAKLGLRVGDFITLISPDGDITPFSATPLPRVKDYKIIQTFKLGVQEIDYNVAFMPFGEAQLYFNKQNQADTLDVFVEDAQNVEQYSDPIFGASRSSIGLYNWKNQNGRLIGAINLERQVMFVILTMIILVAALNIISGLVMLVKDKARDVAIMRTMGMARGSILRIFFICGSSIGVVGSVAGVILGVLFVWNIHAIQGGVEWITGTQVWDPGVRAGIQEIPTKLQFSDVALTLFIALGLSFIATLFPAWKAAKLDPVEALRYE
jgi:lipoprotein-releasing system permease protein